ncbi:MAG: hypothetical protein KDC98_01920 [Planctomycetes bacterium]|nr:hypothetical protein [Planctomycetota bacterium]
MQLSSLTAVLATLASLAPLAAQQLVAPALFDGVEAGSTGNIWRNGTNRYQCVYDSSHFTSRGIEHPIRIHTVQYRLDGGLVGNPTTYPSVEIYLDYCPNDHAAMSTTFDANRTMPLPRTPEYSGPVDVVAASGAEPNDFNVTIALQNPFRYVPELGQDLMVEIVILAPPSPAVGNTMSSAFSIAGHQCAAVRSVGSTTATTGSSTAFCPVIRFGYNDIQGGARHQAFGPGCYSHAVSFYEEYALSANDLTGMTVTATQNGTGGYDVNTAALSSFVAPTSVGLALDDDVVSSAIALPFTFDYPGGSTTSIAIDSNGRIFLNGTTGSSVTASAAGLLSTAVNVLCPSWQDLHPDGATNINNVFVESNLAGTEFYITWNNVSCFPNTQGGNSTFQVALIDNGTSDSFEYRYVTMVNDSTSNSGIMMTAFSPGGGAVDPGASDLTAGTVSTTADAFPLQLSASPRPILGSTCTYTLSNVRATTGFSAIFASWAATTPTSLQVYGLADAAGCYGNIQLNWVVPFGLLMIGSPTASTNVTWPTDPVFVGANVRAQGLELAPLENGDGIITSNGLSILLGNQ